MNAPRRDVPASAGRVLALHLCKGHLVPMASAAEVVARADFGLVGDRHARQGTPRSVLLVDAAILAAEGLRPGQIRENITVEGLPVDGLPRDTLVRCGAEVLLRVTGPCDPCPFIEGIRPGLQAKMEARRGTLCVVEEGGTIRTGDAVVVEESIPNRLP